MLDDPAADVRDVAAADASSLSNRSSTLVLLSSRVAMLLRMGAKFELNMLSNLPNNSRRSSREAALLPPAMAGRAGERLASGHLTLAAGVARGHIEADLA